MRAWHHIPWRRRLDNRAVSETALRTYLDHALQELGIKDGGGSPMRYTFHDFRRIFITDAIMRGMPPHIAQLVAGHRQWDRLVAAFTRRFRRPPAIPPVPETSGANS